MATLLELRACTTCSPSHSSSLSWTLLRISTWIASTEIVNRDKAATKNTGEIRVEIVEVDVGKKINLKHTRATVKKNAAQVNREKRAGLEVAEKALKGRDFTHKITDADEKLSNFVSVKPVVGSGWARPIAIYTFRYRSRDALVKALIIDDLEDLPHHELLRRAHELRREKLLHVPVDIKPEFGVKRERGDDDSKVAFDNNGGEPIDLTEDDDDEPAAKCQRADGIVDLTED